MKTTVTAYLRVPVADDSDLVQFEVLSKVIGLPIPPFPGLHVGANRVANVYVNQGDDPRVYVDMEDADTDCRAVLRGQGWK